MMEFEREDSMIPIGSMVYGTLATILLMIVITVFLAIFTELGWQGSITWPNNSLFLIVLYISIIFGSIMAGWRARQKGWIVGFGTGVFSSVVLLILVLFTHDPVHWGIFLVKALINIFIGIFGGIIGVNISGKG